MATQTYFKLANFRQEQAGLRLAEAKNNSLLDDFRGIITHRAIVDATDHGTNWLLLNARGSLLETASAPAFDLERTKL